MRGVDASRADFRGASLAGVAVHGATLRRADCRQARMAGMWSGPRSHQPKPEVKADEDGTMPPVEPLAATGEEAVRWAEEKATPVDTAKDGDEDAQDDKAWEVHMQGMRTTRSGERFRDDLGQLGSPATLVNMQQMNAR